MAEIRLLAEGDETLLDAVAPDLFDGPIDPAAARDFLADPRLHLAVAIDAGRIVAFASGVHYHHPDKPVPELWIDEVAVAQTHRNRGLARAVVTALLRHGRNLGCGTAWVLTDRTNRAAMKAYAAAGGEETSPDSVMVTFRLDRP